MIVEALATDALMVLAAIEKDVDRAFPATSRRHVSTLLMAKPLVKQMLGYQRRLRRPFRAAVAELASIAGRPLSNRIGGYQVADAEGQTVVDRMALEMVTAAGEAFAKAFATGRGLALGVRGRSRLTPGDVDRMMRGQRARNEHFVRQSLAKDLTAAFAAAIRDASLTAEETGAQIQAVADRWASRVGMYALKLWGVGHLGFAVEFGYVARGVTKQSTADTELLNWVLTSTNPCPDCPKLEQQSPYGPTNPLPTVPGLGDTQCRTNCLCVLTAVEGTGVGGPAQVDHEEWVQERRAEADNVTNVIARRVPPAELSRWDAVAARLAAGEGATDEWVARWLGSSSEHRALVRSMGTEGKLPSPEYLRDRFGENDSAMLQETMFIARESSQPRAGLPELRRGIGVAEDTVGAIKALMKLKPGDEFDLGGPASFTASGRDGSFSARAIQLVLERPRSGLDLRHSNPTEEEVVVSGAMRITRRVDDAKEIAELNYGTTVRRPRVLYFLEQVL